MDARQIIPGATYLITRRCTQRQYLLVPKGQCRQIFHYCLAYAVQRTGVEVHAVVVMSNHYHLVVTDPDGLLPAFVECLNKMVAKCMNAALGRWENFWASEQASYVRLLDAEAVIDKIAYTLCNPVEAALVRQGKEWPGIRFARPGAYPVHRPEGFFREEGCMPKSLVLRLSTPSLGLTTREAQDRIDQAVDSCEKTVRDRVLTAGRTFLGVRGVKQQHPFDSPTTPEPRRGLSPRVATRNKWLRIEALSRCGEFVRQYREALTNWCAENRDALFPVGTYLMRHRHRVRCAEA